MTRKRSADRSDRPRAARSRPGAAAANEPAPPPRWAIPAAWGVVAATAMALVVVAAVLHPIGDYYTETDFYGGYAEGARLIQRGVFDPSRYGVIGPVYELVLALAGLLARDLFTAAHAISIASAAGALALWLGILRRRAGAVQALAALAFLAANPTFFRYGVAVTTDMLAFAADAAALYAVLALRGRWAPLAAGGLCAIAALTRYSAVALLPAALVCYAALAPAESLSRRRAIALCLAGFTLVAGPWLVFALRAGTAPGALLFHDIAYDVYASGRGRTWADYQAGLQPGFHSLLDVVTRDPLGVVRREAANALSHLTGDARQLLGWPAAATCAAGALLAVRDGAWRRLAPLALSGALLYLALVPANYSERYSLVLAPFYLAMAGAAAGSPWLARHLRAGRLPLAPLLACVPLALSLVSSVSAQREAHELLPAEVLPAAAALRAAAAPGARVTAVKPQIAYCSGLGFVPMPPTAHLGELAELCRRQGVGYLYFSWIEANNRPSLWYLLDPRAGVPGLERIAFAARHPAALYRIRPGFGAAPGWLDDDAARAACAARVIASMPPGWAWRAHLSIAIEALERQRFRDALAQASEVIRERPDEALGWRLYGDASAHLHEREQAVTALERAVELEPTSVPSREMLGWLLLGTGRTARAAEVWRPIAGEAPDRVTLARMASLFHDLGQGDAERRSREALERAGR